MNQELKKQPRARSIDSCFLILYTIYMSEEQTSRFSSGIAREFWEIVKVLLISLAIVLPIRYFIAQPFIVRGASMEPNFEDREYLVIDELSYYFRKPQRGEAIVFRYPRDPRQFFIKRIIGLPGETLEVRNGKVRVSNAEYPEGFTLEELYLDPPSKPTRPEFEITLTDDEYYVLGDNREFSSDSRVWGALKQDLIVGRAMFRAWPVERFGTVSNYAIK